MQVQVNTPNQSKSNSFLSSHNNKGYELEKSTTDNFIDEAETTVIMGGVDLSMKEQLRLCLANKEYVFTALGNGCVILFLFLYLTIYGVMLYPYGFTDEEFIANCGVMT